MFDELRLISKNLDEAEVEKIVDELCVATFSVREARKRLDEAHEKMAVCYDRMRQG